MNLLEYLKYEHAKFDEKPLNEVDAALFTQLSMVCAELPACDTGDYTLNPEGFLRHRQGKKVSLSLRDLLCAEFFDRMFTGLASQHVHQALLAAAMNPRYRDVRIVGYRTVLDTAKQVQFSATTFRTDDFTFVAFRGTDTTKTGWREDFNMAYMDSVPCQELGLDYIERTVAFHMGNTQTCQSDAPLFIAGHSKGGNIAEYVVLNAGEELRSKFTRVYSFDGPGFKKDVYKPEDFEPIASLFTKVVPQDSMIGMVLDTHAQFEVTKSTEVGVMQHDLFSWEIEGDHFKRRNGLTPAAITLDMALQKFVHSYDDQQLKRITDALFDTLGDDEVDDLTRLFAGGTTTIQYLREISAKASPENAAVLKATANDLGEAFEISVKEQAEGAINTARTQFEQARSKVEESIRKGEQALRNGERFDLGNLFKSMKAADSGIEAMEGGSQTASEVAEAEDLGLEMSDVVSREGSQQ